jgi:hypothetical protein
VLCASLDAIGIVLERIPGLLPRGLWVEKGFWSVEDLAVTRLVDVLQRGARSITLADLVLRLQTRGLVACAQGDLRRVCDAGEDGVRGGEGREIGEGTEVQCYLGERLPVVKGRDFAALAARDGLNGLVFWPAADSDGFDASNVLEFLVERGTRGAAEGIRVHDNVGHAEGRRAFAADKGETIGQDGQLVSVLIGC